MLVLKLNHIGKRGPRLVTAIKEAMKGHIYSRNHFHEEKGISVWRESFPCGRNHFHVENSLSDRKESFPRGTNRFREEEIVSARKKSFPRGKYYACNIWLYFKRTLINQLTIPLSNHDTTRRWILPAGKFLPRGSSSLSEIFLPRGYMSSLQKQFSLWKYFIRVEMVSSSWKLFLPCRTVFFLAETISSLSNCFLPRGNYFFLVELFSSSRKWFLPCRTVFFLAETISSLSNCFLPRGNGFFLMEMIFGLCISLQGFRITLVELL